MNLAKLLERRAQRGPHRRPADVLAAARANYRPELTHPIDVDQAADNGLDPYPIAEAVPPRSHKRFLAVLVAGAVSCVAVIAAALGMRDSSTVTPAANAAARFRFETPRVLLTAESVEVIDNGRVFTPAGKIDVHGDPGSSDYATLEITWHENGGEQRVYIYFASNGTSWWAFEIRAYNGDWIEPMAKGDFFKSPLGVAHKGDLILPNLRIRGMSVEAFRRPAVCDGAARPLALIANYPVIESWPGNFSATLELIDTQTCTSVAVAPYLFEYVSANTEVAAIETNHRIPNPPETKTRLVVRLAAPGTTTIRATAKDLAGNVVGTTQMDVIVKNQ